MAFAVKLNRGGAFCLLKRATKTAADGPGLTLTRDSRLLALLGRKTDAKKLRDFYSIDFLQLFFDQEFFTKLKQTRESYARIKGRAS